MAQPFRRVETRLSCVSLCYRGRFLSHRNNHPHSYLLHPHHQHCPRTRALLTLGWSRPILGASSFSTSPVLVFSPSHSLFNSNNNNNSNINSNNNNISNNPSASNINTALSHDYDATLPLSKEARVKIETLIEYERIAKKKKEDKKNAPWWNHIHYKIMFTLSVITVAQSFRMVRGEAEERIELLQLRKDKETLEEDLATTEAIALVATKIIDAHERNGEGAIDNIHGLRKELEARLKARYDMIERRKAVEQLRKRTMVD